MLQPIVELACTSQKHFTERHTSYCKAEARQGNAAQDNGMLRLLVIGGLIVEPLSAL